MVGGSQRGTHKTWATKVKTGCLTCKRRRIKCDETTPSCKKCVTHGVQCEGYPDLTDTPRKYAATVSSSGWDVVTPEKMATGSVSTKKSSVGVGEWEGTENCAKSSTSLPVAIETCLREEGDEHEQDYDYDDAEDSIAAVTTTASTWQVITPDMMSLGSGSTRRIASVSDWEGGSGDSSATSLPAVSSHSRQDNERNPDHTHNHHLLQKSSRTVARYYTPASINAWTETFSPYTTAEQRLGLNVWLDLAPMMSRSLQGLTYWSASIPTIAWGHQSVRNAMTATSIIFHSLRKKDGHSEYAIARMSALMYAQRCIQELVITKAPPEAMIACSSLFWIFEMMMGNWTNSMVHLAAGTKIARSTRLSTLSDPLVAQYIRSFVGDLPDSINPVVITGISKEAQRIQSEMRHRYARFIMRDALDRLEVFQVRVDLLQIPSKDRAIQMISRTTRELDLIYRHWPVEIVVDDESTVIQQAIRDHSPFIQLIQDAEIFFQDENIKHITEFETWFRPCIDHFIWLAACLHFQHRQRIIEVWNVKRLEQALPRTNRLLPTTDIEETWTLCNTGPDVVNRADIHCSVPHAFCETTS